jgi:hypothetical protein
MLDLGYQELTLEWQSNGDVPPSQDFLEVVRKEDTATGVRNRLKGS